MRKGIGKSVILLSLFMALISLIECHSRGWEQQFHPFRFGSNKPHLMFHLGSRDTISYNMAYGYWLQKPQSSIQNSQSTAKYSNVFSEMRYKYQNTEQELYINVLNHDGEKLIHERVTDNRYKVQTDIKYLYEQSPNDNYFESQISWKEFINQPKNGSYDIFNHSKTKQKDQKSIRDFQQGNLMWFMALSIENNDLKLINHKDYRSPICFTLQKNSKNTISVHLQEIKLQSNRNYDYERKQTLTFNGKNMQSMKMFGFTVNISESYQFSNYLKEFKHLLEIQKYSDMYIPRTNDSDLVAWENKQIEEMKKGLFDGKYTYVIIYGQVERESLLENQFAEGLPTLYVTNSTNPKKQFDSKRFDILAFQNEDKLFNKKLEGLQKEQDKKFVKHVVYNLMGGLTYYEGKLYTQNSIMSHQHDYSFTFTPSRLIFPRSFLWDDGFHNAIMANYKPDLTLQVLHSWFKKIDLFGWIGREQIRGFEIGSMMPDSRFIYQDVFELNPPTIVLPVLELLENKDKFAQHTALKIQKFLENHFPSLQKHFRYFIKTQSHFDLTYKEDLSATIKYRWRCKDECEKGNFMGSGLDDYPRVQNKGQISKEHIDLSSWLWFFSDALQQIAHHLEKEKVSLYYRKWKNNLRQKIIDDCLDESDMLFKDLAVHGQKLFLDQKVTKLGYINLFPFFVGLLQTYETDSAQRIEKIGRVLSKTMQIMLDETLLMSAGGIRSLSLNDTEYASEQNYWRGASWMPINYMILRACRLYYWDVWSQSQKQRVHTLYYELRSRLIRTVGSNYNKSGYLFQNYIQGEGNRGYPFYGWTSLVANIITEEY